MKEKSAFTTALFIKIRCPVSSVGERHGVNIKSKIGGGGP